MAFCERKRCAEGMYVVGVDPAILHVHGLLNGSETFIRRGKKIVGAADRIDRTIIRRAEVFTKGNERENHHLIAGDFR